MSLPKHRGHLPLYLGKSILNGVGLEILVLDPVEIALMGECPWRSSENPTIRFGNGAEPTVLRALLRKAGEIEGGHIVMLARFRCSRPFRR